MFTVLHIRLCISAGLIAVVSASGYADDTVFVLDQNRGVSAFVIVPPCDDSEFDSAEARGFEAFDATAQAMSECAQASGHAVAEQQSIILGRIFEVHQATSSHADSGVQTVIHAISGSQYSVTFEILVPSRFALNAGLNAAGAMPVVYSDARVRLTAENGEVVLEESIQPGPNGEPNGTVIETTDNLEPGVYTFAASASTVIDAQVPPDGSGSASADAILALARLGDLNGDGSVDVQDLLILLGVWGPCPPPDQSGSSEDCPADLDNSGAIDVLDLLILLGNWG